MGRPRSNANFYYINYKETKKVFMQRLTYLTKQYENDEILEAAHLAEVNRNCFWRLLRKCRKTSGNVSLAIKRPDGTVAHELDDVLAVWKDHFSSLGGPKESPEYDDAHYLEVSNFITNYNHSNHVDDDFLLQPLSTEEVMNAVNALNHGKSPGYDGVTSEHIVYGGEKMFELLRLLFNGIIDLEYVPLCFRVGVQVPLFKGKKLCNLDPNNYRGITLLSSFNKLFEIILWNRIKGWWVDEKVISELQGACKVGMSCIHTAFTLQEAIATSLERGNNCLVAFYDVAKAFDSVWIDGLFKQVFDSGVTGKTWRILYRNYVDFRCCVKIQGNFSEWYPLFCGIHQGGYMSLLKYTVFINSLLVELKNSNLCVKVYDMPSTPVGYADDLATGCFNKTKLDLVMNIVYRHGCTWRYEFNARKSGVLVYDNPRKTHGPSPEHTFRLGGEKVGERTNYDHVGIRASTQVDDVSGIAERISKGRDTFNAATGLGIRKSGLSMATCNVIFWNLVVPSAMYGCELWFLSDKCINILESFQLYVCKRIQRFYSNVPNTSSLYSMGWMRLERYVQVRKLLFIRSIMILDDEAISKRVFCVCARRVFNNLHNDAHATSHSIVRDLLKVASLFDLLNDVINMVNRDHFYPKLLWKNKVWNRAWALEDVYWRIEMQSHRSLDLLKRIDSGCSLLKTDDVRLKRQT